MIGFKSRYQKRNDNPVYHVGQRMIASFTTWVGKPASAMCRLSESGNPLGSSCQFCEDLAGTGLQNFPEGLSMTRRFGASITRYTTKRPSIFDS